MDKHHPAGKTNHPATLEVPVNDHRAVLSVAQYDWPKNTLENPRKSPLRRAAACIRGFIDMLRYVIEKFLVWIPDLLELLDDFLVQEFSAFWWFGTSIECFTTEENINV